MKCFKCEKESHIIIKCKCNNLFCLKCKNPEYHNCNFDYKKNQIIFLSKNMKKIEAEKLTKI